MLASTNDIRRYPLAAFAALACVFGWLPYGLAVAGIGSAPENLPLGPVFAAATVTALGGRGAWRDWGRSLRRGSASPALWSVAVLTPIALHVAIVLVNGRLGAPLPTSAQLSHWPIVPITFAAMFVLVGIGEEAGWTGFAAPQLLERHSLPVTWVLLSALRVFWHLPLLLSGAMPWSVGIVGNAGFQLIVLQLMRRSGGRWMLAAVWHATLNAFGGAFLFTMVTGSDKDRLGLLLAVAYGLTALATTVPTMSSTNSRVVTTATPAQGVSALARPAATGQARRSDPQPRT